MRSTPGALEGSPDDGVGERRQAPSGHRHRPTLARDEPHRRGSGLELDASGYGMGTRGKRFAAVVKDGFVTHLNIEAPGEFKVSSAEYVLGQL